MPFTALCFPFSSSTPLNFTTALVVPHPRASSSTSSIRVMEEEDNAFSDGGAGEEPKRAKAKRRKPNLEASDKLHACDWEGCTKCE